MYIIYFSNISSFNPVYEVISLYVITHLFMLSKNISKIDEKKQVIDDVSYKKAVKNLNKIVYKISVIKNAIEKCVEIVISLGLKSPLNIKCQRKCVLCALITNSYNLSGSVP